MCMQRSNYCISFNVLVFNSLFSALYNYVATMEGAAEQKQKQQQWLIKVSL